METEQTEASWPTVVPTNGSDGEEGPMGTDQQICDTYRFVMSVVIIGPICLFGVIGNILSLAVLRSYDKKSDSGSKSSTSLLLSALAFFDILGLAAVFTMKTVPSFCGFVTDACPGFFDAYPFLLVWGWPSVDLARAYSTWVTVLVTLHRYIAVCKPHKAVVLCTATRGAQQLFVVILLCTLFELPVYLDFHLEIELGVNNKTMLRRVLSPVGRNVVYQILYKTTAYYVIMYAVPLVILGTLTILLVRAIRNSRQTREQMTGNVTASAAMDDITLILVGIVLICMACNPWEPVRRIIEAFLKYQPGCGHFYFWYEELPSLAFSVNSAANFVVYCLLGSRFRAVLRKMFVCSKNGAKMTTGPGSQSRTTLTSVTSDQIRPKIST